MKASKMWDGTDPGATPGKVFTASIGQEEIVQQGSFLDSLKIGLKGAVSTSAVAIETFADLLSEFTLRVGGQERIVLNAKELIALMASYYKETPNIGENTDNTGNDFIGGIHVPIQSPVGPDKPVTISATRTAQSNIGTETIGVTAYWDDKADGKKPIHAVRIALTSAAATGYQELSSRIAPLGRLVKIIALNTNGFGDGNVDCSIQRLRLKLDGELHSQFNALTDYTPVAQGDLVTPLALYTLLKDYMVFDFGPDGVDIKSKEAVMEFDVEDASDAVVFIPVIEME